MRFAVFGAGAIGSYIGGSLLLAGNDVSFYDRQEQIQQLEERGLNLKIGDNQSQIRDLKLFSSISELLHQAKIDAGILSVKAYDTDAFIGTIQHWIDLMPPIICLQNGVENESKLAAVLGEDRVIAGTVTSAIGRDPGGKIILERLRGVGIESQSLAGALVECMNKASLNAKLFDNAASMKWSKMLTNLLANASAAILGMTPAEIFNHPGLFKLEVEQIREAVRIMKKMKLDVVDLPKTPVNMLTKVINLLPVSLSQPILARVLGSARGKKMPSLYLDMEAGKIKSEVDFLNGAVVRFGLKTGVPTPVNDLLVRTLTAIINGTERRDKFYRNPNSLLELL